MSTREFAQKLKISTRKLRKVLRSIRNDGVYTRYSISPAVARRVKQALA